MANSWQSEFLHLASIYLACRLAAMGGTPLLAAHVPVTDFKSLAWAMLGMVDYAAEMRLVLAEQRLYEGGSAR